MRSVAAAPGPLGSRAERRSHRVSSPLPLRTAPLPFPPLRSAVSSTLPWAPSTPTVSIQPGLSGPGRRRFHSVWSEGRRWRGFRLQPLTDSPPSLEGGERGRERAVGAGRLETSPGRACFQPPFPEHRPPIPHSRSGCGHEPLVGGHTCPMGSVRGPVRGEGWGGRTGWQFEMLISRTWSSSGRASPPTSAFIHVLIHS